MAISFTSKKSLQYAVFGAILGLYEIALSKGEIGMTKGEIAKNNFMQGYNCAQAVLLAFCDDLGFDEQTALIPRRSRQMIEPLSSLNLSASC